MSNFEVGEEVRVKSFKIYPGHWVNEMRLMSGKTVIIEKFKRRIELPYKITSCMWGWVESDFEEIINFKLMDDKDFEI